VETASGQEKVMEILGLTPTGIVETTEMLSEPLLIFQLASPANFVVFGPGGWQIGEGVSSNISGGIYSPTDKLIIIPNPNEGNYEVRVTGESGGGTYRLLIGDINQESDFWREEEGQIEEGETKTHQINYSSDIKENKLELLNLAKEKLQQAKEKINSCRWPFRRFLKRIINIRIWQIERIISLLEKGKEKKAEIQLKGVIINLTFFEKNLRFWLKFCPKETSEEIKYLLHETKDYLFQAQEI